MLDRDASEELGWARLEELGQSVDIAEIEHSYRALELEEARVDVEISDCVESSAEVEERLAQLCALQASLLAVAGTLDPMQGVIDATAANAGEISGQVRFLDQERSKLEGALGMVRETSLLKSRLAELLVAMEEKDTDAAAALVHGYANTAPETLDGPFIRLAAPSPGRSRGPEAAAQRGSPRDMIAAATKELVERVTFMFDAAVESNNTREVSRCFRLFPLLGEEARGLDMYSDFMCKVIADKSRLTGDIADNIYALRITRLFEITAVVIDNHFPLVELHYGPGRMLRVIQKLQMEGARRACMVLDFFEEERHISRRLAQIQQADASAMKAKVQSRSAAALPDRGRGARLSDEAISEVDFKAITSILAEIVLIERQIATFSRFLESRAAPEAEALRRDPGSRERVFLAPDAIAKLVPLSSQAAFGTGADGTRGDRSTFDDETGLIANTPLDARLQWLTETYTSLETFFIGRSVAKAMSLDDVDGLVGWQDVISSDPSSGSLASQRGISAGAAGAQARSATKGQAAGFGHSSRAIQQTSSCVGDIFFVVKTALEHAISIQQVAAVEAVVQCAIGAVNAEFLSAMELRALEKWSVGGRGAQGTASQSDSGWRLPGVSTSSSGTTQPAVSTQLSPQAQLQRSILVALNNLDLAGLYLHQTGQSLRSKINNEWAHIPRQEDLSRAQQAIDTLTALSAKFEYSKQRSLDQIGAQVIRPWMRTILQQSYRDIKYVLSDEEFNDMQGDNLFQKRFVLKLKSLTQQLSPRLTAANFASMLEVAIACLAQDWERAIRQSKFNMLGGIMFEKDVREIQRHLEQESGSLLRQRFSRLMQMADVLAVESAAAARHIIGAHAASDVSPDNPALSRKEIAGLLANRIDLSDSEIAKLGL
ncbi:Golgi transport complex subunit 4 [Coemansia sp. RSA 552]|nr:Golgi transport complex subunit 4 [Coemansia sp. RSA 552]